MIAALRRVHLTANSAAALAIAAGGALASAAITLLGGTKTGLALGLGAVIGPALAYLALVAPIVFPFGLYATLVPFDNLLSVAAFGTLTKIAGAITGVALLAFVARTHRAVRPPAALLIWSALVCWMATTAFWALDQSSVFALVPTIAQLVLLYAAVSIFPSDRNAVRCAALAAVFGGVAAAAYGAFLFHSGINIFGSGTRLWIVTDTSEIDPNHFAAALLLPIALSGTIALRARSALIATSAIAAVGIMLIAVIESGSRGAAMAIGAMTVYLFIRGECRLRLALVGAPAAILLALLSSHTSIWSRFAQSLSTGGSNRLPIWKVGLEALKSHWLFGAGYNNFTFAYDRAFLLTHQIQYANWHRAPHDLLLGTSVELGVIGSALLLGGWIAQFTMLRDVPVNDSDYTLRLACEAALIASFVAALFLDVMITKYIWLTFILVVLLRNAHRGLRRA